MIRSKEKQDALVSMLNGMLADGEVLFTFKKANGEIRHARGTRLMEMVPAEDIPSGEQAPCSWCTNYYDLDKGAWRRLINENLLYIGAPDDYDENMYVRLLDILMVWAGVDERTGTSGNEDIDADYQEIKTWVECKRDVLISDAD